MATTSKIERIIEDIYEFVESCKTSTFSQSKAIVPKDQLYELLDELRLCTPDEIKRFQKIINNRDALIKDAEDKAASIIEEAKAKAASMTAEHEIMQQAYFQANEMVSNAAAQADKVLSSANRDAEQIRTGALSYTNDVLEQIEHVLTNAYESTKSKSDLFLESIRSNLEEVSNNRRELTGETEEPQPEEKPLYQGNIDDFAEEPQETPESEEFKYDDSYYTDK